MEEVFRAEEDDWRMIPSPECADRIGGYVDVYTNAASKYPYAEDVYLMLPSFLYHWECVELVSGHGDEAQDMHINYPDTSDIRLLTSRDGISWDQAPGKQPFLRVGLSGGSRSRQLYTAPGFIRVKDELWNYCYGANKNHSGQFDTGTSDNTSDRVKEGIFINKSRLDGFISVDLPYGGGWILTPPIKFTGTELELNIDTSAGGLASVEIQDINGNIIDGFSNDECEPINGNSTSMKVRFKNNKNLLNLSEKPIRIKITAYDTKLYSFQFS